jgi:predicted TIM-barrel fold metal-dependent hydrolase
MIDFHVHHPSAHGVWGGAPYLPEEYLSFMDELAVTASVVFTTDGLFVWDQSTNDETAAFCARDPERLIAFGTVDPRRPGAVEEVKRCLSGLGMSGLKFHPWLQGFCPHEEFMDSICEAAAEAGVPILFHDGTPPYSAPLQIAALARRHPDGVFVLGHAGLHDLWREAIAATTSLDNIYACISGPPTYAIRQIVRRCPAERVLFGTDAGLGRTVDQKYVRSRVHEIMTILTPGERVAILDENPRRLLRLPPSTPRGSAAT